MELLEKHRDILDELNTGVLEYAPESPPMIAQAYKEAVTGGKRMRGLVAFFSCMAVGGDEKVAIHFATLIELAHASSLVHDDLIDGDMLRRGRPAIHVKFGQNTSIVTGDYLFGCAFKALYPLVEEGVISSDVFARISDILLTAERDTCVGEALDIEIIPNNIEEYIEIIEKKTGSLFRAAAEVGAILGGGAENEVNALSNYGMQLGTSFQIRDDVLDVIGAESRLGKPILSDVLSKKNAVVLAHHLLGGKALDEEHAQQLLIDSGAVEHAQKWSVEHAEAAKAFLDELKESEYKTELAKIAEYAANRDL